MNVFVQKILAELKVNSKLNSKPLVKMLAESTEKSIALGEPAALVYKNLKSGLVSINESINDSQLTVIIDMFNKNEDTLDSKVMKVAKAAGLASKISAIKESNAYVNPIVRTKVDACELNLNNGAPDFALCSSFVSAFEEYSYDTTVKGCVDQVKKYLTENRSTLTVLNAIYQVEMMRMPIYAAVNSDLKNMLVSESYSADILKIKYGMSVPFINTLIHELRLIESAETGNFTLGEGNYDTKVNNLISPAIKTEDGLIVYTDNRFLSIRESKGLTGYESKVHVDSKFKIADIDPSYVKSTHQSFYSLCEAYATLGFNRSENGLGVESRALRNATLGFRLNEEKGVDLYINNVKVGDSKSVNVSEALALENNIIKSRVSTILENANSLFNFEFIKEVSNDRTMSEATLVKLNDSYFICEKVNAADREWKAVDEFEMYEFFKNKFNYDISPIFKTKIEESIAELKAIEAEKKNILTNIEKLEASVKKLDEACSSSDIATAETKKLEAIKESIEATIKQLKHNYIKIDLLKKKELA